MSSDSSGYRRCQAGHAEAVGAFDLVAKAYNELLARLAGLNTKKGGK